MKKLFLPITMICLAFLLLVACGQRAKMAEIGQPAPGFKLVDTNGTTWNLEDLKGKVVFLNFWATWCPPCRQELPSMQRVHATMPADTFVMLTILSNDDPAIASSLAAKIGATFPILIDPKNKAAQAYGLTGVPETYIIDKQGMLREKFIGAIQWDSAESLQMLQKYISQ
jgi:cytochrome c biogenesis protein CcmG, thiol:disulfide interchange protein DsbE